MTSRSELRSVAVAVTRDDPPQVFVAESEPALARLVAWKLVAATRASQIRDAILRDDIRTALMEERWGDAVALWLTVTDVALDVYDGEPIWQDDDIDPERVALEIRVSPLFSD